MLHIEHVFYFVYHSINKSDSIYNCKPLLADSHLALVRNDMHKLQLQDSDIMLREPYLFCISPSLSLLSAQVLLADT